MLRDLRGECKKKKEEKQNIQPFKSHRKTDNAEESVLL